MRIDKQKLEQAMVRERISNAALSAAVGLSSSKISRAKREMNVTFHPTIIARIARALNVDVSEITEPVA